MSSVLKRLPGRLAAGRFYNLLSKQQSMSTEKRCVNFWDARVELPHGCQIVRIRTCRGAVTGGHARISGLISGEWINFIWQVHRSPLGDYSMGDRVRANVYGEMAI